MSLWCLMLVALPVAAADPTRELVRKAVANYEESQKKLGTHLFERAVTIQELDAQGTVKEKRSFVVRRELMEDVPVTRVVEREGKPLSEKEAAEQHAQIEKAMRDYRKLTAEERRKRLENASVTGGREMAFLREMPEALEYEFKESVWEQGREILRFTFSPRQGYKPSNMQARVFEKVRGEILIDKAAAEVYALDAEVFDNISLGGFLAKVYKGTRIQLERRPVPEGVWLPSRLKVKAGAQILLVKTLRRETETRYSGYRAWR